MNPKDLRIVFMGTPDFAVESLRRLVEEGYNIVGVVTVPDKPAGRGQKISTSAVKKYAETKGLKIFQPEKLKDEGFLSELRALNPDLGIVIAFRMLPEAVWSMPTLGTFNLHASLLPQYRGAAPIHRAVMNGETVTGVTTFLLDQNIDTGDILLSRSVPIDLSDTAGSVHDKLMCIGAELVEETVHGLASGELKPVKQVCSDVELKTAPKIFNADCRIDWNRPVVEVYNFIRGLSPFPSAWSEYTETDTDGSSRFNFTPCNSHDNGSISDNQTQPTSSNTCKILSVCLIVELHDQIPGTAIIEKSVLKVACPGGFIEIKELQPASKRRMTAGEFICGVKQGKTLFFR